MIARLEHAKDDYLWIWCAACNTHHAVSVTGSHKWEWNGSLEKPTLTPSVKVSYYEGEQVTTICHYMLIDGQQEFCADSTHAFAGKTVPLEDMP